MTRRITKGAVSIPLLALLLTGGCADDAVAVPDGGANNKCAPGLQPMGPACVPIFDECQDDEVPMLGGGCKRVGVKECLDGWGLMGPPDWKCKPIGPPRTCLIGWEKVAGGWCEPILPKTKCPAGTMEVMGKPTCQPVGPPRICQAGWAKAKGGWCEPILPLAACPQGRMEVLGKATCQPIGDCGNNTWGKIKTVAATVYVDQSFKGMGLGTVAQPYKTIGVALDKAKDGDHIAVAAGIYLENLTIKKKVTLEGRCAQKVTILGVIPSYPALDIRSGGDGAVLRGVTLSGAGAGLWVEGVAVSLERVAVKGCAKRGIQVGSAGTLTVRDSLVAGSREVGILLFSSKATLERTVVRDSLERVYDQQGGEGIVTLFDTGLVQPSELTIRDSLISGNRNVGILLFGSKATLERTLVRDTRKRAADSRYGIGIVAQFQTDHSLPSELTMRDSVVARNRYIGIHVLSSKATLERTVVRDTLEQALDKDGGRGIEAAVQTGQSPPPELTIRQSVVAGNRCDGIAAFSSKATLEQTEVRDTLGLASNKKGGRGINAAVQTGLSLPSDLTVSDSLIAGNRAEGVYLSSSKATLERSVVRDTLGQASEGMFGTGIMAVVHDGQSRPSELTLRDSVITGNREDGLSLFSSKATLERTVVRDTRERALDSMFGNGIAAQVQLDQSRPSELLVRDSVIARNREIGIVLNSSKATIERTVVRDTREGASNRQGGMGIGASFQPLQSLPSELTLRQSLITGNRFVGILLQSSKASIDRTVVRDTREQASNNEGGFGISATTYYDRTHPSTLTVSDSLVVRNRVSGISITSSKGTIERTVVRDTLEQVSNKGNGAGIVAQFDHGTVQPEGLTIRDSLVAGNRHSGIRLSSMKATIERTVVRDTQEEAAGKSFGMGIEAFIAEGETRPSELTIRESVIAGNQTLGLLMDGSNATLERVEVRDTRGQASDNSFGTGIHAQVNAANSRPSELIVRDSKVARNLNTGITLISSSGKLSRCAISHSRAQSDGEFGDGVVAAEKATFIIEDTLVERSTRAGLLFIASGGSVHRSLLRANVFAIDLEDGSAPFISEDNKMVDNQINHVTFGQGLKSSPLPTVPNL